MSSVTKLVPAKFRSSPRMRSSSSGCPIDSWICSTIWSGISRTSIVPSGSWAPTEAAAPRRRCRRPLPRKPNRSRIAFSSLLGEPAIAVERPRLRIAVGVGADREIGHDETVTAGRLRRRRWSGRGAARRAPRRWLPSRRCANRNPRRADSSARSSYHAFRDHGCASASGEAYSPRGAACGSVRKSISERAALARAHAEARSSASCNPACGTGRWSLHSRSRRRRTRSASPRGRPMSTEVAGRSCARRNSRRVRRLRAATRTRRRSAGAGSRHAGIRSSDVEAAGAARKKDFYYRSGEARAHVSASELTRQQRRGGESRRGRRRSTRVMRQSERTRRAERAVEADRRLVPVQNRPLEPPASPLDRQPREVDQQGAAIAAATKVRRTNRSSR